MDKVLDSSPADGLVVLTLFLAKLVHHHSGFRDAHASLHRDIDDLGLGHIAVDLKVATFVLTTSIVLLPIRLTLGHFLHDLARLVSRTVRDANTPHDLVENAAATVPLRFWRRAEMVVVEKGYCRATRR